MDNLSEWVKEDPSRVEGIPADVDLSIYRFHHEALRPGYISRRLRGVIEPYAGRFGRGYRVRVPNEKSTQYCFVRYYLEG